MNTSELQHKELIALNSHPFYFGHYLNMARHNAYLILVHLSEKHGFEYPDDEEELLKFQILKFYNDFSNTPDKLLAIKEDFLWYFPMLRTIKKESDFSEKKNKRAKKDHTKPAFEKASVFGKVLRQMFVLLTDLRNRYNHTVYEKDWKHDVNLLLYFNSAIALAQKRMGIVIPESGFDHLIGNDGGKNIYSLYQQRSAKLTEKGVAFFICLFLEEKYGYRFLSRLEHFKKTDTKWALATLKTFTEHCVHLPKERLQSSDIKLDMLNELGRCPAELFYLLSDEDQEHFIQEVIVNKTDIQEEEWAKSISMRRHSDRFPWFAINYFERSNVDPGLHFHVKLGKVLTRDVYEKNVSKTDRDRRLLKPINTLGELSNYSSVAAPPHWYNIKQASTLSGQNKATKYGEIDQYSPQYRIVGNRVGIKIDPEFEVPTWPQLKRKHETNNKRVCRVTNVEPDAILSTYELQNLFVYTYLYHNSKESLVSPTEFIAQYKANFKRFYIDFANGDIDPVSDNLIEKQAERDVGSPEWQKRKKALNKKLSEYNLKDSYLPDDIKSYLLGVEEPPKKAQVLSKVSNMLTTTKKYVGIADKIINREELRWGERISSGQMAQLLADDIVYLLPHNKAKNNKPNNLQYDVLQASLALFSKDRQALHNLFVEFGFTDNRKKEKHPFLAKIDVFSCKGILDFFYQYFTEKQKWLNEVYRKLDDEHFKHIYREFKYLFKVERSAVKKRKYSNTIMLPRGLFNDAIARALNADKGLAINSYLSMLPEFGEYTQPFYHFKRYYLKMEDEDFPTLADKGDPEELIGQIKDDLEIEEDETYRKKLRILKKRILNNEKTLRYRQSNDRVLWLMVNQLFAGEGSDANQGTGLNLKLNELDQIEFKKEGSDFFRKEYPFSYTIVNQGADKTLTVTETMQLKRYGDFRRFFKDRRLKNLVLYFDDETVERNRLIKELDDYESGREELMKKFYRFEQVINQSPFAAQVEINEKSGAKYKEHPSYLAVARQHFNLNKEVAWIVSDDFRFLRNRIMHNQIPEFDWVIDEVKKIKTGSTYSARILDIIGRIYDAMTNKIESTINP